MFPFFSELLLVEEELGRFSTVLRLGEGHETRLPAVTPAEALVAATEIDYRDYRREYVAGEISAEEFLRRIDTTHELTCYKAGKAELSVETRWQRMVARRWDFDPEQHYPESFAYLNLSNEVAQWKIYTADELRRRDQQGHQSLREKYGK